jgi:hypothetical protein
MNRLTTWLYATVIAAALITACKDDDDPIPASEIPALAAVSPNEGTIGTELTISGANFRTGMKVFVGGIASEQVEISSPDLLYAIVPSGIAVNTLLDVTVRNSSGGEATVKNAFKAIPPVLSYINSATKPSGNIGSTVILEGKAFGDLQGTGKVLFSDGLGGTVSAVITNAEDWTDTFILTTVPQGAATGTVVIETGSGTSNGMEFVVSQNATFSPSTINWTLTTALPEAVSGHKAVFASVTDGAGITNNYAYVSGGSNAAGTLNAQMLSGKINADGTVTEWKSTTALPAARAFHATVAATPFNSKAGGSGYLYILGGLNTEGAPVSSVSMAPFNPDGTVGTWTTSKPLPQPLHSAGVVIFRSTIYVAGGSTTNNAPVANVYRATIDESGQLSDWETLESLPSARTYHSLLSFGGFLYSVGGETGSITAEDGNATSNDTKSGEIVYAKINLRTGLLSTGWVVNGSSLQKVRSKHTSLIAGGTIFVSSGLYSGAAQGSSENTYATIASDGSVGSFAGATGSNTLLSKGGINLFNQTGISYVDASGVAHVMIIGGDNVASPGSKTAKVLYY